MNLIDLLNGIEISIVVVSISLFVLSLIAFRTTGLMKILFASAAFMLFTIQFIIEYNDDTLNFLPDVEADIVLSGVTLVILILFFLSLVYKNKH